MISTIAFATGAIVGGLLANFAFKKEKNFINEILEIIIFYLIAYILSERFYQINWIAFLIIGFLSAIIARGISSKFKETTFEIKRKTKVGKVGLLIGLENALRRRGFSSDDIKMIAEEVGFKKEEIQKVIK